MRLDEQLDRALEDALRCRHALGDVLYGMRDAMNGHPRSQNFDASSASSTAWCWEHERDVRDCWKADEFCDGETIRVSDTTGEAGIRHDAAKADHRKLSRLIASLERQSDELTRLCAKYEKRVANELERRETEKVTDPGCELHARVGEWRPPKVESSRVKATLARPHRLCSTCYQYVLDFGRVPTDAELKANVQGRSWKRPA